MPKILYLLDGHAIAYRAYFALTSGGSTRWATSSGEPTAGIYGFASMLLKLLEQEEPDYLAVSFDTGKTFLLSVPNYTQVLNAILGESQCPFEHDLLSVKAGWYHLVSWWGTGLNAPSSMTCFLSEANVPPERREPREVSMPLRA